MRIVFLGNFGVDYSSETHHAASLESLGHEVVRLQEGQASSVSILSACKHADLLVWVHTHGWETPSFEDIHLHNILRWLKESGVPVIGYHLDLYMAIDRWNQYKDSLYFTELDHFFTVEKQLADWLNDNTKVKGHYLQAGVYDKECYMASGTPGGQSDIIFVGSRGYHPEWPYRPQLIDWLHETYGYEFTHVGGDGDIPTTRGAELNQLYSDSKVAVGDSLCINFDYPYYWSDRVYETLGRGGFLIHPYIKGMEEHFTDGTHLRFYEYGNFKQLKYLIDYYLEQDEEREQIRQDGHKHVKQNHTYLNRWETIINEVTK